MGAAFGGGHGLRGCSALELRANVQNDRHQCWVSMPNLIPQETLDSYTAAPSDATVAAVKRLHENIRDILGADFETLLQGSYRNDTSISDLNDVDMPIGVIPQPPANFRSIYRFGPAPVSARSASCRTEVFLRRLDAAGS